jgi:hypothetical protein
MCRVGRTRIANLIYTTICEGHILHFVKAPRFDLHRPSRRWPQPLNNQVAARADSAGVHQPQAERLGPGRDSESDDDLTPSQ